MPMNPPTVEFFCKVAGVNFLAAIRLLEHSSSPGSSTNPLAARLGFFLLRGQSRCSERVCRIRGSSQRNRLRAAELDRAERGEILRILRNLDQIFRLCAFGNRNLALLPHPRNVRLPGLAHPFDKAVRTAEQQHMRTQRMAARQHAEILQNDGLKQ